MSKEQVVDAMVKLTGEEIARLAKDHVEVVEAIASRFDCYYIDMGVQVKDYRDFVNSMDENLKRAEKLMAILDGGEE